MQRRYEEVGTLDSPPKEAGPLDPPSDQLPTSRFIPLSADHHVEEPEQFQQDSDNDSVHTIDYFSDQVPYLTNPPIFSSVSDPDPHGSALRWPP